MCVQQRLAAAESTQISSAGTLDQTFIIVSAAINTFIIYL